MQQLCLTKQHLNSKSKCKRLGRNLFLSIIILALSAMSFTVIAQSQNDIEAVCNKIGTVKLLDESVSIGGSGAGYEWYVVIRQTDKVTGEKYALLISKHRIINQGIAFNTTGGNCYEGSSLQAHITKTEYGYLPPILKAIAVKPKTLGSYTSITAVSEPSSVMAELSNKKDILFPPSYEEVRIWNHGKAPLSLRAEMHSYQVNRWWTRTASNCGGTNYAWEINVPADAFVCTAHVMGSSGTGATGVGFVGAIWVKYSTGLVSVSCTVSGLPNNTGVQVCYKINNEAQQCVTTTAGGAYKIMGIPPNSNVQIIPSTQPGYTATLLFAPNPILDVKTDLNNKDIKYCPVASITGSTHICEGSTTKLFPASGGAWTSSDENVALVNDAGIVTGVGVGTATFTFTGSGQSAGCSSTTGALTVKPAPNAGTIIGLYEVNVGENITLSNTVSGGYWNSRNPQIASVDTVTGLVTGVKGGVATIEYIVVNEGCTSSASIQITVIATALIHSALISASDNNVCPGTPVTFTVTSYNSGASPSYQWKKNGEPIVDAPDASTYTYTPNNGDVITCEVTATDSSAFPNPVTSNSITMQVITLGEHPSVTISVE